MEKSDLTSSLLRLVRSCEATIFTGLSYPEYVLATVETTEEVLFCMMSKRGSADNIVQTFLF